MTVNAVRLNHAVLHVCDLNRSVSFHGAAFGTTVALVDRLDLATEVKQWSGVRTAAELVPLERR